MAGRHGMIAGEWRVKSLHAVVLHCTRDWNIGFIRKAVPASKML